MTTSELDVFSKKFYQDGFLNLIYGKSGSGKTYGLFSLFDLTKPCLNVFEKVFIISTTANSYQNEEYYSRENLKRYFPSAQVYIINATILNESVLMQMLQVFKDSLPESDEIDESDPNFVTISLVEQESDKILSTIPKVPFKSLLIIDDIDFPSQGSKSGQGTDVLQPLIGRQLRHTRTTCFFIKQYMMGRFSRALPLQTNNYLFPAFSPPSVAYFLEVFLVTHVLIAEQKNEFMDWYHKRLLPRLEREKKHIILFGFSTSDLSPLQSGVNFKPRLFFIYRDDGADTSQFGYNVRSKTTDDEADESPAKKRRYVRKIVAK